MNQEIATLAGGCFWCTEAVMERLRGVLKVVSGYTGGTKENPTYEQVCSGYTGHAEAIEVYFDPTTISYATILDVFFATHDPTTLNKQNNDVGTQYRSAIFYHSDEQKNIAQQKKMAIVGAVTEIVEAKTFYPAEQYHQNFYNLNRGGNAYCRVIIDPKIKKLLKDFSSVTVEI